jgi:hypothetical protein
MSLFTRRPPAYLILSYHFLTCPILSIIIIIIIIKRLPACPMWRGPALLSQLGRCPPRRFTLTYLRTRLRPALRLIWATSHLDCSFHTEGRPQNKRPSLQHYAGLENPKPWRTLNFWSSTAQTMQASNALSQPGASSEAGVKINRVRVTKTLPPPVRLNNVLTVSLCYGVVCRGSARSSDRAGPCST